MTPPAKLHVVAAPREVVAVIVVEKDAKGHYHASTSFGGLPVASRSSWYTLLGCLDDIGRALLDLIIFPRARFDEPPAPKEPTP